MTLVFKIVATDEWRAAEKAGVFDGAAVDRADGYIHFSTAAQAAETAAKWFAGRDDLTLVGVDAEALGPLLRWEPSRGGALFPHLYAAAADERRRLVAAAAARPRRPARFREPFGVRPLELFAPLVKLLPPETAHRAAILGPEARAAASGAADPIPASRSRPSGFPFPIRSVSPPGSTRTPRFPGRCLRSASVSSRSAR